MNFVFIKGKYKIWICVAYKPRSQHVYIFSGHIVCKRWKCTTLKWFEGIYSETDWRNGEWGRTMRREFNFYLWLWISKVEKPHWPIAVAFLILDHILVIFFRLPSHRYYKIGSKIWKNGSINISQLSTVNWSVIIHRISKNDRYFVITDLITKRFQW